MQLKINIKRFLPEKKFSDWQTYELEMSEGATILDALIHIRDFMDPTLAFRRACRSAICGSCAVRINHRAKLACKVQIQSELEKFNKIEIEPLRSLPVIKDLVVNMESFWDQIKKIKPWLITKDEPEGKERLMTPENCDKIYKPATCILCAACYSDCPSVEFDSQYLGPAAAVKMYRFCADSRDEAKKERLKTLTKMGLWHCAHAETCVSRCPKEIMPMELISLLREMSFEEKITNNDGARHVQSLYNSIKRCGEMDEARLPLDTFGLFRAIKFWRMGLRMLLRWKMPPLFPKKIKKLEQIKKIYKEIQKSNSEIQNKFKI